MARGRLYAHRNPRDLLALGLLALLLIVYLDCHSSQEFAMQFTNIFRESKF